MFYIISTSDCRYNVGNTNVPFSIQSASKPLNYALALSELGPDEVHKMVVARRELKRFA